MICPRPLACEANLVCNCLSLCSLRSLRFINCRFSAKVGQALHKCGTRNSNPEPRLRRLQPQNEGLLDFEFRTSFGLRISRLRRATAGLLLALAALASAAAAAFGFQGCAFLPPRATRVQSSPAWTAFAGSSAGSWSPSRGPSNLSRRTSRPTSGFSRAAATSFATPKKSPMWPFSAALPPRSMPGLPNRPGAGWSIWSIITLRSPMPPSISGCRREKPHRQ